MGSASTTAAPLSSGWFVGCCRIDVNLASRTEPVDSSQRLHDTRRAQGAAPVSAALMRISSDSKILSSPDLANSGQSTCSRISSNPDLANSGHTTFSTISSNPDLANGGQTTWPCLAEAHETTAADGLRRAPRRRLVVASARTLVRATART